MARSKEPHISPLNEEQLQAVLTTEGALRVAACAGSGKTTMLVERFAYLVEHKHADPARILLVTFSADAKADMERRLKRRLPHVDIDHSVRTAHSIGLEIFRAEHHGETWTIDPTGTIYRQIVDHVLHEHRIPSVREEFLEFANTVKQEVLGYHHEYTRALGAVNEKMLAAARRVSIDPEKTMKLFYEVEGHRRDGVAVKDHEGDVHPVTYDDMLYDAAIALQLEHTRHRWASRYDYVMQDETQDESTVQRSVIEPLASVSGNYCVVGDPAQAIYGFRGSRPDGILKFEQRWPGAQTIKLVGNYRSGDMIIEAANSSLTAMPADTVVELQMVGKRRLPGLITGSVHQEPADEAHAIAEHILATHEDEEWRDVAVLVRTNTALGPLRLALAERRIPFRIEGRESVPKGAKNVVTLSTIHKAKGREWKDVYVAQLGTGPWRDTGDDQVEERRVFYVAITRARDNLHLSYSTRSEYEYHATRRPCRFTEEIGIDMHGNLV